MLKSMLVRKENELINEIAEERNLFRMFKKAIELRGLINYMNSNVQ